MKLAVAASRLSVDEVRRSIADNLDQRPLTLALVACDLATSRSQIQRALAATDTTFTDEVRKARVATALNLLLNRGRSVTETATAVGVSQDHLRVIVLGTCGVTPGALRRSFTLVQRARRWRRQVPPAFGTALYWERRRGWTRLDRELRRLLRPARTNSPVSQWAAAALAHGQRPDYRRQPLRDSVQEHRAREARARSEWLQRWLAESGWPSISQER